MKDYKCCINPQESEIILSPNPHKRGNKSLILSGLNKLLHQVILALNSGQDPKIWQTEDRFGNTYWHAYDPVTGRSVSRVSEGEVRCWLEKR